MKLKLSALSQPYMAALQKHLKQGPLQAEIAQTLLGVNGWLHSLKQQAKGNSNGFKNEIVSTQRLGLRLVDSARWFVRELGTHGHA